MKTLLCTHNYNLHTGTIDKLVSIAVKSSSTLMGSQVQIQTSLLGFDGTKSPDLVTIGDLQAPITYLFQRIVCIG